MPSDISRTSDEQRYDGVVMQQGRVILDRDVNALRQTIDRRIEHDALDIIGPCGTPDNGFAIGPAPGSSSPVSPPLWVPPIPAGESACCRAVRFFDIRRHHVCRRSASGVPRECARTRRRRIQLLRSAELALLPPRRRCHPTRNSFICTCSKTK